MFHLTNGRFSYYVQIHPSGMLLNPYFGAYVEDIDVEQINPIGGHDWFSHYYCHTDGKEKEYRDLYLNASPMVFPSSRAADVRPSAADINARATTSWISVTFRTAYTAENPRLRRCLSCVTAKTKRKLLKS